MRISDHTLNRLNILKAIRRFGPVARTDLPGLTGLSAGLITQQTSDLVARDLVTERRGESKRLGRPRILLEINADSAIVIGASISGPNLLAVAFMNLSGQKVFSIGIPFKQSHCLPELVDNLVFALRQAVVESPFEMGDIARIGIGLPGVLDSIRGNVHFVPFLPAEITPFAAPISNHLGVPVTIENEMVCMARAEHWFGRAREHDDFTMIHVGLSVMSAEYAQGLPKYGSNGLNSEIGHMKTGFGQNARHCFCGAAGCLTSYCSAYGMLDAAGLLQDVPFPPFDRLSARFERFIDRVGEGDADAADAVRLAGTHLGVAIANHLNSTDPGMVYIAVDNAKYLPLLQEPFRAALQANTLPGVLPATKIAFFQANEDWRWTGTAALALEQTYLDDARNSSERGAASRRTVKKQPVVALDDLGKDRNGKSFRIAH